MRPKAVVSERGSRRNLSKTVDCPIQPGGLKISKSSCIRRHKLARSRESHPAFYPKDDFTYFIDRGLSICLDCPHLNSFLSN